MGLTRAAPAIQRAPARTARRGDPLEDPLVDPLGDPLAAPPSLRGAASAPVQRDSDDEMSVESDSESEWSESEDEAPPGYMDPSDYYDEFGGSDHSDMDGTVWVARISNRPALWWQNPDEQSVLHLTGTRPGDIAALGGDDAGLTWHHCADYAGGNCTMQQVPTAEHASWGHIGGASQAGYGVDG